MNAFYLDGKKRTIDTINEPEQRPMVFHKILFALKDRLFFRSSNGAFDFQIPFFAGDLKTLFKISAFADHLPQIKLIDQNTVLIGKIFSPLPVQVFALRESCEIVKFIL